MVRMELITICHLSLKQTKPSAWVGWLDSRTQLVASRAMVCNFLKVLLNLKAILEVPITFLEVTLWSHTRDHTHIRVGCHSSGAVPFIF